MTSSIELQFRLNEAHRDNRPLTVSPDDVYELIELRLEIARLKRQLARKGKKK